MKKTDRDKIIERAKRKTRRQKRLRQDLRYLQVIGRLKHEGLLDIKTVPAYRGKFLLKEALWVGESIEPRVLELLPAIVLKRPGMMLFEELPEDLNEVVIGLRKGEEGKSFRGVGFKSYGQWLLEVGRKGLYPKVSKTFRFSREDQALLEQLSQQKGISETDVIRLAIRKLGRASSTKNS